MANRRWMKLQTLGLIILLSDAPRPAIAKSQSFTLGDLPTCALMCATQAASAVNCTMNDTPCLCSHPNFTTSTIQCADTNGQCPIEDMASVDGVLGAICLAGSTLSASSSSSSSSRSSQGDPISTSKGLGPGPIKPLPSTTSTPPPSSSPTSPSLLPSAPSATPSSTNDVSSLILSSRSSATSTPTTATTPASQSANSTTVVIQTIMVPPTSLASSAVREQWDVWIMMFWVWWGCVCVLGFESLGIF